MTPVSSVATSSRASDSASRIRTSPREAWLLTVPIDRPSSAAVSASVSSS
ncbi:hypothetical protein [Catenulispora rubra]|nr:hypothetical protein [Catenulispora rubra]